MTLGGNVNTYGEKWAAERAAGRVFGVKAVAEEIKVRLPGSSERSDADIAKAAVNALEWDMSVPHDRIKVQVQSGWVTLNGEVDWWHQKEAAWDAIHNLMGVRGISNQITIKPTVQPVEVKAKIESALQRNALLDARQIGVEARGSKVILSGNLRTWAEREQAQWAVWAAPSVSEVENNIKIGH